MTQKLQQHSSFYSLGIAPRILEVLDKMRFTVPTPIQHKAIPVAIEGKDIIGIAQTGTGKTLAFAIPIIQQFAQKKGRCLILAPTRELAIQIDEAFQKIAVIFGIRTAVLIGGASMHLQLQALRRNPRIIIATPGRLIDHMDQRTVMLADVSILVLDEADRMLDMGFLPDIKRILRVIPKDRQTMLFSATIPGEIMEIASAHMKLPVRVEMAPSGTTAERIVQEVFVVRKDMKKELLKKLLYQYHGPVLLFSRTKIGASKITRFIRELGHRVAEIHSDRSLPQRREALEGFKRGKYRILVATDIASRGIDVIGIELVINYDLPEDVENYVHRIGRTGRAGHEGRAISFATPEQGMDVKSIEKLIKTDLCILEHPDLPRERFLHPKQYIPSSRNRTHGHGQKRHFKPHSRRNFGR
ncbi:MAG: DEAD/DEAH box helicase [Candidatus Omnitrophica bacterium]|nr:DEAD/DEAH box helicase [Candidatus Omnitrophota bacterium]MBU4488519.1 DEAD/DEAH box helicase [Candidatus Omnitrophota bacterium]MCG2704569.1 DEAD/DEAH box helicase [Candidatus Omnitrophota bacterium]